MGNETQTGRSRGAVDCERVTARVRQDLEFRYAGGQPVTGGSRVLARRPSLQPSQTRSNIDTVGGHGMYSARG
jgi:hypothetical protein